MYLACQRVRYVCLVHKLRPDTLPIHQSSSVALVASGQQRLAALQPSVLWLTPNQESYVSDGQQQ